MRGVVLKQSEKKKSVQGVYEGAFILWHRIKLKKAKNKKIKKKSVRE